ncbi:MAG: type II toxin-antitoxin system VapC family toxin [Rickettsia endosymbiont of Labidopullus appendiculatus]|nr:type II toxin-antitoxin system VapC family toxin [Rickettsia endosymbiont of Labidopullus appendiculatus]
MKVLFDTNILIDYLLGHLSANRELEQYKDCQISIITKMEILAGTSEDNEETIREFLDNFTIIGLNEKIAEIAISIRKEHKIKLPDAIIWATAKYCNGLLITRNTKDFPIHAPDIKVPYNI